MPHRMFRRHDAGMFGPTTGDRVPLPADTLRLAFAFAFAFAVTLPVAAAQPLPVTPARAATNAPTATPLSPLYETRPATRDGIGKFFLGREIAHVMGHEGAAWLERPERLDEERPDLLHDLLALQPGLTVADIGAGTGYHSWRMARKVGPTGRVFAVDIQPEMLTYLSTNMPARGVTNVVGVLGTLTDPKLPPAAIDLVLMVDVYHEFDHPFEMLSAIAKSLKPGGRVAFVEFRGEQVSVPIKALHKMTEAQIRREASLHPLEWIETRRELPWQHLILFRKK